MYLLTRPVEKAATSQTYFAESGLDVCILSPVTTQPFEDAAQRITGCLAQQPAIILVVSTLAAQLLATHAKHIAPSTRVFAVGESSAAILKSVGLNVAQGIQQNSEGLLAHQQLQSIAGESVLLVKGQDGRELIESTLFERGAAVTACDVYRRINLPTPVTSKDWNWTQIDGIIATSGGMIEAIMGYYPDLPLRNLRWLTVSQRLHDLLLTYGIKNSAICPIATDKAIANWLKQHWESL